MNRKVSPLLSRELRVGPSIDAPVNSRARVSSSMLLPLLLFLPAATFGQVTPQQGTMQGPGRPGYPPGYPGYPNSHYPNPQAGNPGIGPGMSPAGNPNATTPAPAPVTAVAAPSLLDQPAQAAKVDLAAGKLTIQADNSSLTAILHQVSASAGMTVDGLNKDVRVFGTYGPGDPRDILSSLLDGTGYNVVMFGKTSAGTPSQLALSTRGASLPSGSQGIQRGAIVQNQEDEEEPAPTQYQDPAPAPQPTNQQPGPGNPTPPNGGVRSPQQMLQELQQMHQQQQQDQQTPPQPQ